MEVFKKSKIEILESKLEELKDSLIKARRKSSGSYSGNGTSNGSRGRAGRNKGLTPFVPQFTAKEQAHNTAKEQSKINRKQPVKTELNPELKSKLEAQTNLVKEESNKKEEITFAKNGQWSLDKSGYGPKGADLYDPHVNQNRKENRTGDEVAAAGKNRAVHAYTSAKQGTAQQQASAIAAKQKELNVKQPIKTEIPADLKAKLEAEANKK
jgi:hypothetical protein